MMDEKKSKILRGQIPTSVFYILFGLCLALMPVENGECSVQGGIWAGSDRGPLFITF